MYRDKTILAIVPARSGSKRIPDKNMQKINGVSLIGWAGKCLQELDWLDRIAFSTDSTKYAKEAMKYALVPHIRPLELCTDNSPIEDTLFYLFQNSADIILLIEPTSPMRKPSDIKNAVDLLIDTGVDSVVTLSEIDPKFGRKSSGIFNGKVWAINFPHTVTFYRNGICYALTRETVQKKQIITDNTAPLFIERTVVNIDTPLDLEIARMLMKDA